jgi:hypothetical protein
MKKYILAAALVLASTSAMADRMVSGTGMESPGSHSKVSACEDAKLNARRMAELDEQVESYSRCDCEENSSGQWTCAVDARVEKKR